MHLLNERQRQAATHKEGPCLVVAGAGSGKTRVVIERILNLMNEGVEPNEIIGLTFTNKAAKEMVRRIEAASDKSVLITTFHSLGARIVRQNYLSLGFKERPLIFDEEETRSLVRDLLKEEGIEGKQEPKKWQDKISLYKSGRREEADPLFDKIYRRYQEKMRALAAIDFDDLLLLPLELFQTNAEILDHYHSRWRYFLVDEYQDTNKIQADLLTLLTQKERNLFAVGDPDQSIYSWRGAESGTMNQFLRLFPDHTLIPLEQNYRSTEAILEAANCLIEKNTGRIEKRLWSQLGQGEKPHYYRARRDLDEASYVVRQMILARSEGTPFSEMAIFYRTHAQSRVLEDSFRSMQIPYRLIGALSFYDRAEIRDMVAFLRLLVRPEDYMAFSRVVNLPSRGVGKESLRKMVAFSEESRLPILEVAKKAANKEPLIPFTLPAKARAGLASFCEKMATLKSQMEATPLPMLLKKIYEEMDLESVLNEAAETATDKKENVQEFINKAREYYFTHEDEGILGFLNEISLVSEVKGESNEPSVSIMSLHHAKGLEFDIVAIVGIEEMLLPHVNSFASRDAIEEERRLLYVGITRAKKKLCLTSSQTRFLWGEERFCEPSRFLREIPPPLLRRYP